MQSSAAKRIRGECKTLCEGKTTRRRRPKFILSARHLDLKIQAFLPHYIPFSFISYFSQSFPISAHPQNDNSISSFLARHLIRTTAFPPFERGKLPCSFLGFYFVHILYVHIIALMLQHDDSETDSTAIFFVFSVLRVLPCCPKTAGLVVVVCRNSGLLGLFMSSHY